MPTGQKKNLMGRSPIFRNYRHIFIAVAGWLVFFALFFSLKFLIQPRYYIHCPLDDRIPFVKWFFPVYCLWYLYLFAALLYFGLASKPDFIRLQSYLFIGMGICLAVYAVFPNAIRFRPAIVGNDWISRIMAAMFSIDSPTMVTPSMHVFAAVAVHVSLAKSKLTGGSRPLVALSFAVMALICLSTVLIKQHSVIDVFWGAALAAALYFPVYGIGKKGASFGRPRQGK